MITNQHFCYLTENMKCISSPGGTVYLAQIPLLGSALPPAKIVPLLLLLLISPLYSPLQCRCHWLCSSFMLALDVTI